MSANLRELVETVQDWVGNDANRETVVSDINRSIRSICSRHKFDALTEFKEIELENGIFSVPPLCREIKSVRTTDHEEVAEVHNLPAKHEVAKAVPRVYPVGVSHYALDRVRLSGDESSDTLTQDAVQDDGSWEIKAGHLGAGLKIEGFDDLFEITEVDAGISVTVRPFLPTDFTGELALIGTNGLRIYKVYDSDLKVHPGPVVIEYQRFHPYLYNDDDRLEVDIRESVALTAVKNGLRHFKYDVDAVRLDQDLENAMAAELGAQITAHKKRSTLPSAFSVGRSRAWRRRLKRR